MEEFAFQRALAALWEFIGAVNRYVDTNQPWALAKDPAAAPAAGPRAASRWPTRSRYLGVMLTAFLPDAAAKIRAAIGQTAAPRLADAEIGGLDRLPRGAEALRALSARRSRTRPRRPISRQRERAASAPERPTRQRRRPGHHRRLPARSICAWPR